MLPVQGDSITVKNPHLLILLAMLASTPASAQPTIGTFLEQSGTSGTVGVGTATLNVGTGDDTVSPINGGSGSGSIQQYQNLASDPLPTTAGEETLIQGGSIKVDITDPTGTVPAETEVVLDGTYTVGAPIIGGSGGVELLADLSNGSHTSLVDLGNFSGTSESFSTIFTLPTSSNAYHVGFILLEAGNQPADSATITINAKFVPEIDPSSAALPLLAAMGALAIATDCRRKQKPRRSS